MRCYQPSGQLKRYKHDATDPCCYVMRKLHVLFCCFVDLTGFILKITATGHNELQKYQHSLLSRCREGTKYKSVCCKVMVTNLAIILAGCDVTVERRLALDQMVLVVYREWKDCRQKFTRSGRIVD